MSASTRASDRPSPSRAAKGSGAAARAPKRTAAKRVTTEKRPTPERRTAAKRTTTKKRATPERRTAEKRTPAKKRTAKKSVARSRSSATKPSAAAVRLRRGIGDPARTGARNLLERREQVRIERRQRRRSVIIVLAALTGLCAISLGLLNSPLLDIDRVEVRGTEVVAPEVVTAAAAVPLGSPIVDLDAQGVADRVAEIPRVLSASVGRNWDGTVVITVTEREPTLALRAAGGYVLVDRGGRQVSLVESSPDGFVPVVGLEASGVAGDPGPNGTTEVLHLMEAMTPAARAAVGEVVVTGDSMSLRLIEGGRVVLGQDDELDAKMIALETVLEQVDLRCVHEIDITVPSAPAISRIGPNGNPREGLADLTQCS